MRERELQLERELARTREREREFLQLQPLTTPPVSTQTKARETAQEMRKRIQEEEEAALMAELQMQQDEQQMRLEIRDALRRDLHKRKHNSPDKEALCLSDIMSSASRSTASTQNAHSAINPSSALEHELPKRISVLSMYDEIEDLKRKIARMEGEQRVEPSAHREGELEMARFDLRSLQRGRRNVGE